MFVPDDIWVTAELQGIPSSTPCRPGQPVTMSIYVYPSAPTAATFGGSPAGNCFSTAPAENATGNYVDIGSASR